MTVKINLYKHGLSKEVHYKSQQLVLKKINQFSVLYSFIQSVVGVCTFCDMMPISSLHFTIETKFKIVSFSLVFCFESNVSLLSGFLLALIVTIIVILLVVVVVLL